MEKEALKEKLAVDIKEVISDAEALLKITADDVTEKTKEIRANLSARLDNAKAQLSDQGVLVKKKAVAGAKETDRVIRANPYQSLGAAFGLGIVLGTILNRR